MVKWRVGLQKYLHFENRQVAALAIFSKQMFDPATGHIDWIRNTINKGPQQDVQIQSEITEKGFDTAYWDQLRARGSGDGDHRRGECRYKE